MLAEHATERLGALWVREVERAVRIVAPRYPPQIYATGTTWSPEALEDLAQDVVVSQLLAEGQLEYITVTATDLKGARALLARQVKWTLARRRSRTVVDNLLGRCRTITAEGDYHLLLGRSGWQLGRELSTGTDTGHGREPTSAEIVEAARRVARLPRVPVKGGDHAPMIYRTEVLRTLLENVAAGLPGGFNDNDLDRIFSRVLTDHLPGALVVSDGSVDEADRSLTPEEEYIVTSLADQAYSALSTEQRVLLGMKMADRSDEQVASELGLSRPTVAKRHRAAAGDVRGYLQDLPAHVQDRALSALAGRLLAHVPTDAEDPLP